MGGSHALFWLSHPVLEFLSPFGDLQAAIIPFSQARHISNKLIDRLRGWERTVSKSVSECFSAFIHEKELVQPNHCTVVCI